MTVQRGAKSAWERGSRRVSVRGHGSPVSADSRLPTYDTLTIWSAALMKRVSIAWTTGSRPPKMRHLPMLFGNLDCVNIDTVFEPALLLTNGNVIPAHLSLPHTAVFMESPVFKPIATLPLHAIMCILVLVPELDRNLIVGEGKELLAQFVVVFFVPFPGQEVDDGGGAGEEFVSVSPDAIFGVCLGHAFWVTAIRQWKEVLVLREEGGQLTEYSRGLGPS